MATSKNIGPPYERPPRNAAKAHIQANWWNMPITNEMARRFTKTSLDALTRKYTAYKERWQDSKYREMVDELFEKAILRQTFIIDQAICLGLGSLATKNHANEPLYPHGDCIMSQFVVFEHFIMLLRKKYKIEHVYFQDPDLIQIDADFLESRGFEALENGEAYELMTTETFLFAPIGNYVWVIENCIQEAYPPLMISNSPENRRHGGLVPEQIEGVDVLLSMTRLDDMKQATELRRRGLLWPFYNHRICRRLLKLDFADKRDLESPENIEMVWMLWMWIYWVPDNKSRLTRPLKIEEEQDFCTCLRCQIKLDGVRGPDTYSPTHVPPVSSNPKDSIPSGGKENSDGSKKPSIPSDADKNTSDVPPTRLPSSQPSSRGSTRNGDGENKLAPVTSATRSLQNDGETSDDTSPAEETSSSDNDGDAGDELPPPATGPTPIAGNTRKGHGKTLVDVNSAEISGLPHPQSQQENWRRRGWGALASALIG